MPKSIDKIVITLNHRCFFANKRIIAVSPLEQQGHCNQNYLLRTAQTSYILRLFGEEERDRVMEYRLQQLAFRYTLAPEPHLLDLDAGFMVSAYVSGVHRQILSVQQLQALAKHLAALHHIPYQEKQIHSDEVLHHPNTSIYEPVLCHHDLNPYNILWQDDIPTFIDWEYAGIDDRYFDLASVTVEFKLDEQMCVLFLKSYFDDHGAIDTKKLHIYQTHYQNLCEQWWQKKRSLLADS